MSFPLYPEKYKLPARVSARQMLEFRRAQGRLKGLDAPEGVVLSLYNGVMKRFGWKYPSRHITSFQCDLYLLNRTGGRVGVLGNFGMGAPAVVALAEQMIAWGTQRLAILSLAGGLQPELAPGEIVLGERAFRDEGTSYHYLPPAEQVQAGLALVDALARRLGERGLPFARGAIWSTDAAYRETREEIEHFSGKGVQAVDMESAGLFALGQVQQVQTASIFVVGHNLVGPQWSAPSDLRALHLRFKLLLNVLIDVLSEKV